MDKKFEEKINKMAFGELSEAEATEVKAHAAANADAAKALASYEALRSDLSLMRDVPPDQLSKERLQNAILAGGLKPKPVRRAFPWAWAGTGTAALAAIAFAMVMNTGQPQQVVDNFKPDVASQPSILETQPVEDMPALNISDMDYVAASMPKAIEEAAPAPEGYQRNPDKSSVEKLKRSRGSNRKEDRRLTSRSVDSNPVAMSATTLALAVPAKSDSDTLVLINNDLDDSTGASTAIEVKHSETQDVVVSS